MGSSPNRGRKGAFSGPNDSATLAMMLSRPSWLTLRTTSLLPVTFIPPSTLAACLSSAPGGPDIFVAKFSASGTAVWAKRFGGTMNDQGFALALDANDNIFLGAEFQGDANFGGVALTSAALSLDIALAKLSSAGATLWAKRQGGSDMDLVNALALDQAGDVIVTGQVMGASDLGGGPTAGAGIFLAKYAGADGGYRWGKVFGTIIDHVGFFQLQQRCLPGRGPHSR